VPDDDFSGGRPTPPPKAAGLNRVVWDLRYEPAVTFPRMILWGAGTQGPMALPGRYTVRLTADGMVQTKPLVLRRNPLLTDVTDADLRAQFALGLKVRDKLTEANNAVIQIRALKTGAADRMAKNADARLKTAGDRLVTNLSDVEDDIYQVKNQSGQDPLNFPIKINNRIADLGRVVNTGEGRPTANAAVLFDEYAKVLAVETNRLQRVLSTDLVAFNAELTRLGLATLSCSICGLVP